MLTLYIGQDSEMNYIWIEDPANDRCALLDYDVDEPTANSYERNFTSGNMTEAEYGEDWKPGVDSIRCKMIEYDKLAERE